MRVKDRAPVSPASPLRLGIIGFGQLARGYYTPALRAFPGPLAVSIADPLAESRRAARRALPEAAVFEDYRQLLERTSLDAVLVASPPATHLEVWDDLSELRLPVFMEKPFPLSRELERIDPRDPAWDRLMLDLNRRFWPPYRELARRIRSGELGRPKRTRLTLHIDLRAWRRIGNHRTQAGQGGVLHDLGSHALDLLMMIFGEEPIQILAKRSTNTGFVERLELQLMFAAGHAVCCDLAYSRHNRESLSIHCDGGTIRLANPNGRVWLERRPSPLHDWLSRCGDTALIACRAVARHRSMLRFSVCAALHAFLRAVQKGDRFDPGFTDTYRLAAWTAAAVRSMELGRPLAPTSP